MNVFKKIALSVLIVLFLNIAVSSIVEINAINTSLHNIKIASNIASKYALNSFEITQFSGFDNNVGSVYDIGNPQNRTAYENYLRNIETQGTVKNINKPGSDFSAIIYFLKSELERYDDFGGSVLAPFAFNWTYLEEKRLSDEFKRTVNNIIDANYSPTGDDMALAFSGRDVVRITDAKAKIINGPTLINLSEGLANKNSPDYKTYLSLFGSTRQEAMAMHSSLSSVEDIYNYIIVYDVEFTISWEHHTITPFFNSLNRAIPSQFVNEKGQIKLTMEPTKLIRRYVVTN